MPQAVAQVSDHRPVWSHICQLLSYSLFS